LRQAPQNRKAQSLQPSFSDEPPEPMPVRPAIWADGKQAPTFRPWVFAEAGMLLAREASGNALTYLSTTALARATSIGAQDWRLAHRLGRTGGLLPTAPGVARSLGRFAHRADKARRLLYGLPAVANPAPNPPSERAPPEPVRAASTPPHPPQHSAPRPAPPAPAMADRDLDMAAIRALLRAEPAPQKPGRSAQPPHNWETSPQDAANAPVLQKVLDWSIVRVLAGGVLVLAMPLGYGRALYRHLDGADLHEIVADCHRMRVN
jgi:hypothetical protein